MSGTGQPTPLISDPEFELSHIVREEGTTYILEGGVDSAGSARVLEALQNEPGRTGVAEFLMEDAELTDGASVARMVDAVRFLLSRFDRVRLIRSPQMLAHTLYKVGMLQGADLELVEPREEEGGAG